MKYTECTVGQTVRDTRNSTVYTVTGNRLYASDCGAWVEQTEKNADGIKELSVVHWSHLEPMTAETGYTENCNGCTPARMCTDHAIEHNTGSTGIVFFPAPVDLDTEE